MIEIIEIVFAMGAIIGNVWIGILIGRNHGTFKKFALAVLESFKK